LRWNAGVLADWRGGVLAATSRTTYCARITLLQSIVPFNFTPAAVVASNVTTAVEP
jgi:hypothetical protein